MTIKVISGEVIHKGNIIGIGGVIYDIDKVNAERLCKCGLCEITEDVVCGDETEEGTKDLEEMTKKELISYATSIGIEVDERANKAKIIEIITNADSLKTGMPL